MSHFLRAVTVHPGEGRVHEFDLSLFDVVDMYPPPCMGENVLPPGENGIVLLECRPVSENHQGSRDLTGLPDGDTDALHVDGMPALLPKNGVVALVRDTLAANWEYRTLRGGRRTTGAFSIRDDMGDEVLAEILPGVAQHPLCLGVDEGHPPLAVQPIDAIAYVLQDQLVLARGLARNGLDFPGPPGERLDATVQEQGTHQGQQDVPGEVRPCTALLDRAGFLRGGYDAADQPVRHQQGQHSKKRHDENFPVSLELAKETLGYFEEFLDEFEVFD